MREQSGASRRTSQCPRNRTQGSLTRIARLTSVGAVDVIRGAVLVPDPGGGADGFRFARDERALPATTAPGFAGGRGCRVRRCGASIGRRFGERKRLLDQLAHFFGWLRGVRRILLHLRPEAHRVAQLAGGQQAQPLVVFGQDEGLAARGDRVAVALFDGFGGFAPASDHRCSPAIARYALVVSRTRSSVYAAGHASSRSFTPQIRRPSSSRQVPKFSMCRSPTASTMGAFATSSQTSGQCCSQR